MGDLVSKIKFLLVILVLGTLITGCGNKQAQNTKTPANQIAVIDMNKAMQAHPKYSQLMTLAKQADTLEAQLQAQQLADEKVQIANLTPKISESEMDQLNKSFEQEFNTKIEAKQDELNVAIKGKANTFSQTLSDEMNAYNEQIDKDYQPQLVDLEIKLKKVDLKPEEKTSLEAEVDKIHAKRSAALEEKQKQLTTRMDELMAPEKAALEQELQAYAKQMNEEMSKQIEAKQAEIIARNNEQSTPGATASSEADEIQKQLVMKQQELEALQGFILQNISEKTGKVATEDGIEAVLTNVAVNVSAVDITTKVIAECNK